MKRREFITLLGGAAVSTPDELRALSAADLTRSDVLSVLPDAMFWNHRTTIIALMQAGISCSESPRPAFKPLC